MDYWGYNRVSFFSPNSSYASKKEELIEEPSSSICIPAAHANGIDVILDVVSIAPQEETNSARVLDSKALTTTFTTC